MQINLTELFSCQGKMKTYTQDLDMTTFQAPNGTYEIVDKEPVTLEITHIGDKKLTVSGEAKFALMIPCDRCLTPVKVPFELKLEEELNTDLTEEERVEALDEQPYVSGYYLDVDQLVGSELILNLPMKVLCKEDCKGICEQCGQNLNEGTCSCEHGPSDPRMSVIQDIFKQFKEV